jgi:hypothetical protein
MNFGMLISPMTSLSYRALPIVPAAPEACVQASLSPPGYLFSHNPVARRGAAQNAPIASDGFGPHLSAMEYVNLCFFFAHSHIEGWQRGWQRTSRNVDSLAKAATLSDYYHLISDWRCRRTAIGAAEKAGAARQD